ncbi:MAG: thermonuclease family protein [Nitrospinae bacterium]|nr:thermonuclease family protein [Nitrospinota bacterium]
MIYRFAISLSLCATLAFQTPAYAEEKKEENLIIGTVTRIYDGDTIGVTGDNGKFIRVQLAYIDAPDFEKGMKAPQPAYRESMETLARMIMNKEVIVESFGPDKSGKVDGMVFLDAVEVNVEMVLKGMAEIYFPMRSNPSAYKKEYMDKLFEAEKTAKENKTGIWSDPNYVSPYTLRHKNPQPAAE